MHEDTKQEIAESENIPLDALVMRFLRELNETP